MLVALLASMGVCFTLTFVVRKFLRDRAMLDHPNARSSHTVPVPRGGGWAVVGTLVPALVLTAWQNHTLAHYTPLIVGLCGLAGISWLDDRRGVPPLLRLGMHIGAAALGAMTFPPDAMVFGGVLPFWLDRATIILGWAWFMNLYNFMDGIDGITGVETVALASGLCFVMGLAGISDPMTPLLTMALIGAALGFLAFNWHPATIFLGDVGSVPLGFLTGFGLLGFALHGQLIPALILPLYYLADSGITITKRAVRGEKIWQAHRQHFYQRSALGCGRHDRVVYAIMIGNTALIAAAMVAVVYPWVGLGCGVASVAILLLWMHKTASLRN